MKTISNIFYEEDPETQKNMCNIGLIIEHEPNKNYGGTNYVVETVIQREEGGPHAKISEYHTRPGI